LRDAGAIVRSVVSDFASEALVASGAPAGLARDMARETHLAGCRSPFASRIGSVLHDVVSVIALAVACVVVCVSDVEGHVRPANDA